MDPGFKGCGCRVPSIQSTQREIDGQTIQVLQCGNLGCGAEWRQAGGRSYQQIKGPEDPDRPGSIKPHRPAEFKQPEPTKEQPPDSKTEEKPPENADNLVKTMFATLTERLKDDPDPETATMIQKLSGKILGDKDSETTEDANKDGPDLAAFDDVVWPVILELRASNQGVTSWGEAAFRIQGACDKFIAWAHAGASPDADGLGMLAFIAAEAQTAAEFLGLVAEDCVDAEEDAAPAS